jgi:hypothetical protein
MGWGGGGEAERVFKEKDESGKEEVRERKELREDCELTRKKELT